MTRTLLQKSTDNIDSAVNKGIRKFVGIYKNLPIRIKLMVVLNIAILIPLVTISLVNYKTSQNMLQSKSVQYSQDMLKIINQRLDDYISSLDAISNQLIDDKTIISAVNSGATDSLEIYHEQETIGGILKNTIRQNTGTQKKQVSSISIFIDRNKAPLYADDSAASESINEIMPYGGALYKGAVSAAKKGGGSSVWFFDSSEKNVKHIFYVRIINDRYTYKNAGIMVIMVNSDWFKTVFDGLVNEDMKKTFVVSQDMKTILVKSSAADVKMTDGEFKKMSGGQGWFIDSGKNALISYVYSKRTGWKIVSDIPLSTLYRDVDSIRRNILIALAAALALLLLTSFYVSYDFITSINRLVKGMERLEKGEEDVQVRLDRKDEIGFMGSAFNKMVREITTLQKWVLREQLTRKDAQIKALQSQINPHFLFNTLETINWMAQLNGVTEISETVTALGSLMEASIARNDRCITFEQEISYIDNYIIILKKRFDDRLELVKSVDEAALQVEIPRLLIQPLVENAVNHGVANIRGKGVVGLIARVKDSRLDITVEDNGVGFDPDELSIMNERLAMDDEEYFIARKTKKSGGIGLENVNRRIKLFYGPEYGVTIESTKGEYTRVHVAIPSNFSEKPYDKANQADSGDGDSEV